MENTKALPSPPPREGRRKLSFRRVFDGENRRSVLLGRIVLITLFLSFWQLGADRLFETFYFSKPSSIALQFWKELFDPDFYNDLWITGVEMFLGYGIGAIAGVFLGIIFARWDYLSKVVDPFLLALNSIPRIAIAPLLIVWFGIDMTSKVVLAATLVFFIMFFNTLSGVRAVNRAYCDIARIQGASERQIFMKVMLPSASSWIITGLKMSLPFALVGVIIGEFMVSSHGLGYRLNHYSTSYNTTGALTIIVLMMIVMMVLTAVVDRIEARLLRWRPANPGAAENFKV